MRNGTNGVSLTPNIAHTFALLFSAVARIALGLVAIMAICTPTRIRAQTTLPRPDHIVIVIEENRSLRQISSFVKHHPDSYLASLMKQGTSFKSFFALFHPSQPNYIDLFSGDRYGVTNDNHPGRLFSPLVAPSIGGELRKKG